MASPANVKQAWWTPQPGPQAWASVCPADEIFFGGTRGGGKGQPKSAEILTNFGIKTFAEVHPGMQICNPDGTVARIIAVYPRGEQLIYRFTFDDGATCLADLDHIWLNRWSQHKPKADRQYLHNSEHLRWRLSTTAELIKAIGKNKKIRMPLCKPIAFTKSFKYPIGMDPYLLGLLLGDGSIVDRISLYSDDLEIQEYIAGIGFRPLPGNPRNYYLPIDNDIAKLYLYLDKLKLLGKRAWEKCIPYRFKFSSADSRLAILQGLLDTDGYADSRGHIQFTSTSKQLALDVQFLVRSLGGKATLTEKTGQYRDPNDEIVQCRQVYMLYIQHPDKASLFRLPRKSERCKGKEWNGGHELTRKLMDIEYVGKEETTCIQTDHPNGLYLTDDFIVTHNTDCAIGRHVQGAEQWGKYWNGLALRRKYKDFAEMRRRIDELISEGMPAERVGGENQVNYVRWADGAVLSLHAVQHEKMLDDFQGQQFCVAEGTPILLGDGSYKAIEDVCPGDRVMTLNGPSVVTRRMPSRISPCVEFTTPFGRQVNPVNHPILTACGWQSYASILDACSITIEDYIRGSCKPPDVYVTAILHKCGQDQDRQFVRTPIENCNACRSGPQCLGKLEGPSLGYLNLWRLGEPSQRFQDHEPWIQVVCDRAYVQTCSGKAADSQYDCQMGYYLYGERLPGLIGSDQGGIPLRVDAASPYLNGQYMQDVQGSIPRYNPDGALLYAHPYDGQVLTSSEGSTFETCKFSFHGNCEVYDLTIKDYNHYISKCQVINVNTEITIDEAPNFPFVATAVDRLKGCLRSPHGVPCHMFLTGNPGGVASSMVRFMYIEPKVDGKKVPYGKVWVTQDGATRVFIQSTVYDNKILLENDPRYVKRLESIQDAALRAAWLEGRWDVFVGQAFNFTPRHILGKPIPIPDYAPIYMTFDWGYGKPFSIGWWWVDAENRVYRFSEWYGWNKESGKPNEGLRIPDSQIADGIKLRETEMGLGGRNITRLCGPDCFSKKPDYKGGGQGPSTAEVFENAGVILQPADADRMKKIRMFRNRLGVISDDGDTMPMLMVYPGCEDFIRTIPDLTIDDSGEDIEQDGEDHIYDEACHICMARPVSLDLVQLQTMEDQRRIEEHREQLSRDSTSLVALDEYQAIKAMLAAQEDGDAERIEDLLRSQGLMDML